MKKKYKIDITYGVNIRKPVTYTHRIVDEPIKRSWFRKLGITFKIFGRKFTL